MLTSTNLAMKSIIELRQMCTARNIPGMSQENDKDVLVSGLLDFQRANGEQGIAANLNVRGGTQSNTGSVRVSSGASSGNYPVAGKSIGDIRRQLREVLNVSPDAQGIVNGETVQSGHIVEDGDNVEFIKRAGKKG